MFFQRNLAGHSKPYQPDPDREESRRTKHTAEVREGKKIPDSHHRAQQLARVIKDSRQTAKSTHMVCELPATMTSYEFSNMLLPWGNVKTLA